MQDFQDNQVSQDDQTNQDDADTQVGSVKWFNSQKGYGFIAPDAGGDHLFVHANNIAGEGFKSLEEGQQVEFTVGEGRKGKEAQNVREI